MAKSVAATVQKIDDLRARITQSRRKSATAFEIENTFERDIILKGLELLRESIHTASLLKQLHDGR